MQTYFNEEATVAKAFEAALEAALNNGELCPTDTGVSYATMKAINAVARAYPSATEDLVSQARSAYAAEQET